MEGINEFDALMSSGGKNELELFYDFTNDLDKLRKESFIRVFLELNTMLREN